MSGRGQFLLTIKVMIMNHEESRSTYTKATDQSQCCIFFKLVFKLGIHNITVFHFPYGQVGSM